MRNRFEYFGWERDKEKMDVWENVSKIWIKHQDFIINDHPFINPLFEQCLSNTVIDSHWTNGYHCLLVFRTECRKVDRYFFVIENFSVEYILHTHISIEGNALFAGPTMVPYCIHDSSIIPFLKFPKDFYFSFSVFTKFHSYFNYVKDRNRRAWSKKSSAAQTAITTVSKYCRSHQR